MVRASGLQHLFWRARMMVQGGGAAANSFNSTREQASPDRNSRLRVVSTAMPARRACVWLIRGRGLGGFDRQKGAVCMRFAAAAATESLCFLLSPLLHAQLCLPPPSHPAGSTALLQAQLKRGQYQNAPRSRRPHPCARPRSAASSSAPPRSSPGRR